MTSDDNSAGSIEGFCDTIRLMSNDLALKRHHDQIYDCFWPTPQSKMIVPNRDETGERGRRPQGNRLGRMNYWNFDVKPRPPDADPWRG
jgi:hypothetical protein